MSQNDSHFEVPGELDVTRLGPGTESAPERIGPYRVLQKLGEGGMGVIYEAEQERPVRRRVALKVIKRGMDTDQVIVRFESERQALALMGHPNIARVYDAGATPEGRPFFAMEFVRGIPITDYCDRNRLSTADRLQLFIQVCEGVQHAHQKGIIHRDIKPSNVLVSDEDGRRVPKIIDFGIAKATAQRLTERTFYTEMGQLIGTPEYMSPEQAEMSGLDIDTRTDVYLLGVMLYELLTGEQPFDAGQIRELGFDEFRRRVIEDDPPRPSTRVTALGQASGPPANQRRIEAPAWRRQLSGDLDWITMKALEKDRTRRYASASELAADVGRYLRHEPVLASPPSNLYRLRKFVVRHRAGAGFAAALAVVLAGFGVSLVVQSRSIARERDQKEAARAAAVREQQRAQEEAEAAGMLSEFLLDLFRVSDPSEARGNSITAREMLERGADRVRSEKREQPRLRAQFMRTIGNVYGNLGLNRESRTLLEEALRIQQAELGDQDLETAETMEALANVLAFPFGEFKRARYYYQQALYVRRNQLGPDDPSIGSTLNKLANLLLIVGEYDWALDYYDDAIEILEKAPAGNETELAKLLNNRARYTVVGLGDHATAQALFERALRTALDAEEPDLLQEAQIRHNLGEVHEVAGDLATARQYHERAFEIRRRLLDPDHVDVGHSELLLARLALREGDRARADELHARAMAVFRDDGSSLNNPSILYDLATFACLAGEREEALRYLRRAVVEMDFGGEQGLLQDPNLAPLRGEPQFQAIVAIARARSRGLG